MIKINLAGAAVSAKSSGPMAGVDAAFAAEAGAAGTLRSRAVKNLGIILIGPVGLLLYEQVTIPELQSALRARQAESAVLTEKNLKAREAVEQTKKFRKEQALLQAQIDSIESLKKDRLREVRVLDFIQKDIPDRLWLLKMDLNDGKLLIEGLATTDSELTQFMDVLSRSAYLQEVSLVRSTDFSSNEYGRLKRFEISCLMEKAP